MIDRNDLLTALNNIAPESIQESWDNCGLQIDVGRQAYNKILVCLEITRDVINEAIEKGAEIIVTHHPLYFRETKNVLRGTIPGDYTIDLIKHDIAKVISKYMKIDTDSMEIEINNASSKGKRKKNPTLYANIPILDMKNG